MFRENLNKKNILKDIFPKFYLVQKSYKKDFFKIYLEMLRKKMFLEKYRNVLISQNVSHRSVYYKINCKKVSKEKTDKG